MIKSFDELLNIVESHPSKVVVVPGAHSKSVVEAAIEAKKLDLAEFLLIGEKEKIINYIDEIDNSFKNEFNIKDESDLQNACILAVQSVNNGKAEIILKGKTDTSMLIRAVLDKEKGLRTGKLLSDVFVFETEERLTIMSDGGVNLYPNLEEKIDIIENAVKVAHCLENPQPKVALLSAVETVNPNMPPTIDSAVIAKMSERNQIKDCIIDGPFALDNAISEKSAKIKGIESTVAGKADILIMPNIESGNIFGKALTYYAHLKVAHVVMGAKAPILITSRADDAETKMLSIALGIISSTFNI